MNTSSIMKILMLLCILMSATITNCEDQRHKRDIDYIKNIMKSTFLKFNSFVKSKFEASKLPAKDIVYVTKLQNGSYVYQTSKYKLYLTPIPAQNPTNVVDLISPPVVEKKPILSVVESYLGTKTPQETVGALVDVNNLIQSGILNAQEVFVPIATHPPKIVYEQHEENGKEVRPLQLSLPIEHSEKPFVNIQKPSNDPAKIPYVAPEVNRPYFTSYGLPLPAVQSIEAIKKMHNIKMPTITNVVPNINQQIPPATVKNSPIPKEGAQKNRYYFKQINSDGNVTIYNAEHQDNAPYSTIYVDDSYAYVKPIATPPRHIVERTHKVATDVKNNPQIPKTYSHKIINNDALTGKQGTANTILNTIVSSKNTSTQEQSNSYKYKQIQTDGSTVFYGNATQQQLIDTASPEINTRFSENFDVKPVFSEYTRPALKRILFTQPEVNGNLDVNNYIYNDSLGNEAYYKNKVNENQESYIRLTQQKLPLAIPIKSTVEVYVNNIPTSHTNFTIPESLEKQAFVYKYRLLGNLDNDAVQIQQLPKLSEITNIIFNNAPLPTESNLLVTDKDKSKETTNPHDTLKNYSYSETNDENLIQLLSDGKAEKFKAISGSDGHKEIFSGRSTNTSSLKTKTDQYNYKLIRDQNELGANKDQNKELTDENTSKQEGGLQSSRLNSENYNYVYKVIKNIVRNDTGENTEQKLSTTENINFQKNPIIILPEENNIYNYKQIKNDGTVSNIVGTDNNEVKVQVENSDTDTHRGDIP